MDFSAIKKVEYRKVANYKNAEAAEKTSQMLQVRNLTKLD